MRGAMLIRIAFLLGAVAAVPALAQPVPADKVPVAIETSAGRIVVALDKAHAPVTTANFLHYVDTHRFDGESFYRAMHVPDADGNDGGLIQAGIRSDARKLYGPIAHESTAQSGLRNLAGTISMARLEPGSAKADFFILVSDMPGFDAGGPGGDPDGFAAFGPVNEGVELVKKKLASPVSPTKGDGPMQGQMLEPPVKIIKASRLKP
jgi:peptidyl-prolyl cis-trans isomerase A (cyclophilin A)